jgi:hypothetical protein
MIDIHPDPPYLLCREDREMRNGNDNGIMTPRESQCADCRAVLAREAALVEALRLVQYELDTYQYSHGCDKPIRDAVRAALALVDGAE